MTLISEIKESFPCHPKHLVNIRKILQDFNEKNNIPVGDRFKLELAVDEACMNAIDHGSALNQTMEFDFWLKLYTDKIVILIKDYGGKPFDPEYFESIAQKKTWGHGGRGIFLIKKLMDEVMYCFNHKKSTLLTMVKYVESPKPVSE